MDAANPLLALHESSGAEIQDYAQTPIVSTFGSPEAEYAAIRKSCGLMDLPQRGVIELTGADRLAFLNNLLTNETWNKQRKAGLVAGQGVYAFFLSGKGRVTADVNVLELGERTLLETDGRLVEVLRQGLDRYLFAEKVKIASRVGELHELALHGPGAMQVLGEALGEQPLLQPTACVAAMLFGHDVVIWRDDPTGAAGFNVILPAAAAAEIWTTLLERFCGPLAPPAEGGWDAARKRSLRPVGWAAFNSTRIEAGRSLLGIDFDDTVLPAETGQLQRAVSFTKGCYLGQEIVARMHARNQVARQVVGLRMEDDALPIAGAPVYDQEQNQVGGITSSTVSPVLSGASICLGLMKKGFTAPATTVYIAAEGSVRPAKVVELPFYRA